MFCLGEIITNFYKFKNQSYLPIVDRSLLEFRINRWNSIIIFNNVACPNFNKYSFLVSNLFSP